MLRTKWLVKASKWTSTLNGLPGRHTSIVSPLKIQKIFLNMVKIIFGKHKDPRIEKIKAHSRKRLQNFLINRQIEKVDNRKIKITYDLMIWSMATPC